MTPFVTGILLDLSIVLGTTMSPQASKDLQLINACIEGNKKAWDRFVDAYSGVIYHAINRILSKTYSSTQVDLSDDLFQTVFKLLLDNNKNKLKSFEGKAKLSTWLYTVTSNIIKDYLGSKDFKSQSLQTSFDGISENGLSHEEKLADKKPQPHEKLEQKEREDLINLVKKQLNQREQLFFNLCFDKGQSLSDIAKIMNTNKNNIYQIKNRVTEKLSILIDDFYKRSEQFSSN